MCKKGIETRPVGPQTTIPFLHNTLSTLSEIERAALFGRGRGELRIEILLDWKLETGDVVVVVPVDELPRAVFFYTQFRDGRVFVQGARCYGAALYAEEAVE